MKEVLYRHIEKNQKSEPPILSALDGEYIVSWFFARDSGLPSGSKVLQIVATKGVHAYELYGSHTERRIGSASEVEEQNVHGGQIHMLLEQVKIVDELVEAPSKDRKYIKRLFDDRLATHQKTLDRIKSVVDIIELC